ncbi:MAG: M48 family metalloprotease [Deltaproteobacteria bacterium]|nr:M48 family metalloprotease [Candidatus Zymogenaceae bacterium]
MDTVYHYCIILGLLMAAPTLFLELFYLVSYRTFLTMLVSDREMIARKRWNLFRHTNGVFILCIVAETTVIVLALPECVSSPVRALFSIACIFFTFFPYMLLQGRIDRSIRHIDYSYGGYVKFQLFFFFSRFSAVFILLVFLHVPFLKIENPYDISVSRIFILIAALTLFVLAVLFQTRLVGAMTKILVRSDDDPLTERIQKMGDRAGVGRIRLFIMNTYDYPYFNAFAAPFGILYFTRPLLDELTEGEVLAVAAHEIGHLKTMARRTVFVLIVYALMALTVWVFFPLGYALFHRGEWVSLAVIVGFVTLLLIIFGARSWSRVYEQKADDIAAELIDEPETLVTALERIYEMNMIPRRFDAHGSERASHPSLERRVAHLRGEDLPKPKKLTCGRVVLFIIAVLVVTLFLVSRNYYGDWESDYDYQGSWADPIRSHEMRIEEHPDDYEILKEAAIFYYYYGYDLEGLRTAEKAEELGVDHQLLLVKGVMQYYLGRRIGAIESLEESYRMGGNVMALKWAAYLHAMRGDGEAAREALDTCRMLIPWDPYMGELDTYLDGRAEYILPPGYLLVGEGKAGYLLWLYEYDE